MVGKEEMHILVDKLEWVWEEVERFDGLLRCLVFGYCMRK